MKLYTHTGVFHADEVFATAVLMELYSTAEIKRISFVSDEMKEMEEKGEAIIYDIGGGYFDHHQKGGNGFRWMDDKENPRGIFSSFGLIWQEFGKDYCQKICRRVNELSDLPFDIVAKYVDSSFVMGIDVIDTGEYKTDEESVVIFNVSNIISLYNKDWYVSSNNDDNFFDAVNTAKEILIRVVKREAAKLAAKDVVTNAINKSKDGIIIFDRFVPWQAPVQEAEKDILFVVFPSMRGGWNVQGVPPFAGSRDQKIPFPVDWRGAKELPGVPDFMFCHPAGFIAGAETKESCIKMAKMAIEQAK